MKLIKTIATLTMLLTITLTTSAAPTGQSFRAGNKTFLLNDQPFVIKAAEIHYPRIPRQYWDHRIKMCKALGMNTVCIYIFWNIHQPSESQYDFTGNLDIAEFCRTAQRNGMYVIVRPGPYVCAEWEMGGLPWWLLKNKDIQLRKLDNTFMNHVRNFEKKVAEQLSPLTIQNGGPIIMIQVENEYGSYGKDKAYVSAIRDELRKDYGNEITLFQCDWSSNFKDNALDDLLWTMNFGTGANIDEQFKELKQLRPDTPLMCSEFWSGWFDKWGGKHETRSSKDMVSGLKEMLDKNISFSLYMTHGGTSFGHWAGANSPGFAPDVTSYDYDAPINEYGQPTEKFWELRSMLQKYSKTKLPSVPKAPMPVISIPKFQADLFASIWNYDKYPVTNTVLPQTMEEFNQGFGSIIYTTTIPARTRPAKLHIENGHDYIQVFTEDKGLIGCIDRRLGDKDIIIPSGPKTKIKLVVEAMGRINFGTAIKDFKGIVGNVELTIEIDGNDFTSNLRNWETHLIPDDYQFYTSRTYTPITTPNAVFRQPGFYKTTFKVSKPGDTFIDMSTWGKGLVYVNGHALGRFWEIGPQQTLYCPGCWLKKGENEIIIFDIVGPKSATLSGLNHPIIDKLLDEEPPIHRKEGETLTLSGETPITLKTAEGTATIGQFAPGNGWKTVQFANPVTGRYICLEALNSFDGKEYACIAELYIKDEKGERLSREPWKIRYADSEDIKTGNRAADKIYDLQESTFWSTLKDVAYPHTIIIDLGKEHTITSIDYLPRMETTTPGAIKQFKLYVKKNEFTIK